MTTLIAIELRRALARRLVRILIGLALLATAVTGVVVFVQTGSPGPHGPIRLVELWPAGDGDPILLATAVLLVIGALFAGASVAGAEWRTGSIVTLLTWEPRRVRLATARIVATGLAAATIGVAMQVVFSLALLPALLVHGTTAGADVAWFWGLVGGVARSALLTGLAAVLGASLAMIGRNTALALGVAFVYLNVVEGAVRAWKPWAGRWLISENVAIFLSARSLEGLPFTRSTVAAATTIVLYIAGVATLATVLFRRRDVAN